MTIKAVIFDLDGTITEPSLNFDDIRLEMGLTVDAGPILEAMEKMSPDQLRRAEAVLFDHEHRAMQHSKLNPKARELLESLRKSGIGIGILTRNRKDNALAVLKNHDLPYDIAIGREDGPVKPDAFGVMHICSFFGIRPDETLLVGDYLFDLQCAKAAGAKAVLIHMQKDSKDFVEFADYEISSLDQLTNIIENESRI